MPVQRRQARRVVRCIHRREIAFQRRLRIHHDRRATRQSHDHVGTLHAGVRRHGDLRREVAVLQHAGQLHHALQLQLAPAPARGWRTQRLHQVARLAAKPVAHAVHLQQPLGHLTHGLRAVAIQLREACVVRREQLAHRVQQRGNGLLTLLGMRGAIGLQRGQLGACAGEERGLRVAQRVGGDRLEGRAHRLLRIAEGRDLRGGRRRGACTLGRADAGGGDPGQHAANGDASDEGQQQDDGVGHDPGAAGDTRAPTHDAPAHAEYRGVMTAKYRWRISARCTGAASRPSGRQHGDAWPAHRPASA